MSEPLPAFSASFFRKSDDLAKHAYLVMRLYCQERGLTRDEFAAALAGLCVEVRSEYPGGTQRFDAIAAKAQEHYQKSRK